jgi:predicted permease
MSGIEKRKDERRDRRRANWVQDLVEDLRYGLRMFRNSPGFTAVALLTVALGIGANTTIFSVVEGVMLAPLPYFEPERLVVVWTTNSQFNNLTSPSYPNFQDWQRNTRSFQEMAALRWQGFDLMNLGTAEHVDGAEVSSGFFTTLGVKLTLGRSFSPQEDQRGGAPVVIISNRFWRNRFSSSPGVLAKTVTLDGVDYTVVGVLPSGFYFYGDAVGLYGPDVYIPLGQGDPLMLSPRDAPAIFSIARLKPGVSIAQARAEMNSVQENLDELYPDADRGLGATVVPLKEQIVGNVGETLLLLLGAVGLVLLIACANVANLLLARSSARAREFAVRSALGANRARLIRQSLTESVLLATGGGALGLLVALCGLRLVIAAVPGSLPRGQDIGLNAPVIFFAFGVVFAVGILFGMAPALKNSKSGLHEALKEGGRTSSGGRHRTQNSLVIIQMALTLVLLVGAGLLFRTIRHLWETHPGFDAKNIITFKVGFSPSLTKTATSTRTAYRQLLERIRMIPGVQAADFTYIVPLSGEDNVAPFWIGPSKPTEVQGMPQTLVFDTGPDYLRTMGIPLLRGRFFTPEDNNGSPCVAVIDSVFAQTYFSDKDPLGQSMTFGWTPPWGPCQIIGVVGHVRHWGLGDESLYIRSQSYFPLYQLPDQWVTASQGYPATWMVVRTSLPAATVIPAIRSVVYGNSRDQPVYDVRTMREIALESASSQRFPMMLLGAFAGLALLLASVGIYGVISYSVARRGREIGIRMTLGAHKRDVFRIIVGQCLRLALLGLVIGVAAALVLARLLPSFSHLLYGVRASDPLTFFVVSLMLIAVAVLACYIPARRAMRVDPMVALRYE